MTIAMANYVDTLITKVIFKDQNEELELINFNIIPFLKECSLNIQDEITTITMNIKKTESITHLGVNTWFSQLRGPQSVDFKIYSSIGKPIYHFVLRNVKLKDYNEKYEMYKSQFTFSSIDNLTEE